MPIVTGGGTKGDERITSGVRPNTSGGKSLLKFKKGTIGPITPKDYVFSPKKPTYSPEAEKFHINQIKDGLRDLAKQNLFYVYFESPDSHPPVEFLPHLVKSATFPSVEISKITIKRCGYDVHLPGDVNFGECQITFWADVDQNVRNWFHAWQLKHIACYERFLGSVPTVALTGKLYIEQLDPSYNVTYGVALSNVWPSTISEISVSHDNEHVRQEFSVNFAYSYYECYSQEYEE